ncbi:Nucleolar complex protein 2 [Sesbania bispinosa]|nr:Nucleolar complex protein 2 [Sesbania bispinosa]
MSGSDDEERLDRVQQVNDHNTRSWVGKLLTCASVDSLCKLVKEQHSVSALTCLINAYRAACHSDSEATSASGCVLSHGIQKSETFCKILMFMLHEADTIFRSLLGIPISSSRKETVLDLKKTIKWLSLRPLIKSYLRSTMFLLNQVTDSEILTFAICRLRASIIFLAAFPSLLHKLLKISVHLWATGDGSLSSNTFLIIQDIASVFSSDWNSFVELCCLDVQKSSNKAMICIQHLEYKITKDGGKPGKVFERWSTIKLPKHWLKSREFQEECVSSAIELLSEHFAQWSYHISFPELATAPLIHLKKLFERTSIESFRRVIKRFIDQVEMNIDFVQKKRDEVPFSPKDQQFIESFLQVEKRNGNTPFTQYYKSMMSKAASRKMISKRKSPSKGKKKRSIQMALLM